MRAVGAKSTRCPSRGNVIDRLSGGAALAVSLAIMACAGPGRDGASVPRSAPPIVTEPKATPVASGKASAPGAGTAEATPFRLVAVAQEELELVPLGEETFVNVGCPRGGPFASARLGPAGIELSNRLTEGWSYCLMCACNYQGWSPDHVFREAPRGGPGDGCTTQNFQVKRGKRWQPIHGPGGGFLAVSAWSKNRKLVFGQDCGRTTGVVVLDAKDRVIRAADTPKIGPEVSPEVGTVAGFASFPTGELLLLSQPDDTGPARLSMWRDGASKPVVHPLPGAGSEWQSASMVARSPRDVFIGASTAKGPYLARLDGSTWTNVPVSDPKELQRLRPAQDGGVWFVGAGPRLWRMDRSGAFRSLLLPPTFTLVDMIEVSPDDVWVISDRELYRNRPVAQPVAIVSDCPGIFDDAPDRASTLLEHCKPRFEPRIGLSSERPR
jgi:hypothetical protein